jgi:hypothetical protein
MENNNNENNLFTSMFGIESEEEQPSPAQPVQQTQPVQEAKFFTEQPVAPQQPVPQPVAQSMPQQPTEPTIELTSNKPAEEQIFLSSDPIPQNQTMSDNQFNIQMTQQPIQQSEYTQQTDYTAPQKESNPAIIYVIFGLILLVVIVGPMLFGAVGNMNSPETQNNNQQTEEKNEENVPPVEEKEPTPQAPEVTFDGTMSFYKSLTTNAKELNQTVGYQPTYDRGVVKCGTTKSRTITGGTQTEEIYLYYENYQVKKSLNITKTKASNKSTYNQLVESGKYLKNLDEQHKNYKFSSKQNASTRTYEATTFFELAYGNKITIPETKYYVYLPYSLNTPIKSAMNKILQKEGFKGISTCSTVVTN